MAGTKIRFKDGEKVHHNTWGACTVDGNVYEAGDGTERVFIADSAGALHNVVAETCIRLDAKTAIQKLRAIKTLADQLIAKVESGDYDDTSDLYAALFDGADALEPFFLS